VYPEGSQCLWEIDWSLPGTYSAEQSAIVTEIQQKIYFYGWCIDRRDFDALDALFMPDAMVHYDVQDGMCAPWTEMKKWLPEGLEIFRLTQHNMSNPMIEISGTDARSKTYGHLIHFQEKADESISVMRHHSIYHDEWVLQDEGWRISARRLSNIYFDGPVFRGDEIVAYRQPKPF
jgi:hypothetical protein